MRLEKYLKESYFDTFVIRQGNHTFEVFKNPSKSEVLDIKKSYDGSYRCIVDMKKKDFYIASGKTIHKELIAHSKIGSIVKVSYNEFENGKGMDRFIFFNLLGWGRKVNSDTWLYYAHKNGIDDVREKVLGQDLTWLNKWDGLGDKLQSYIKTL